METDTAKINVGAWPALITPLFVITLLLYCLTILLDKS